MLARVRAAGPAPRATGLRILAYHSIGSSLRGDRYGLSLPPKIFAEQMRAVAGGAFGKVVPLADAKLDGSAEIAITFDDGYVDALTAAAPILSGLRLSFAVCVTPGLLDSGAPHLSWPQLRELSRVPDCAIGAHGLTHARLTELPDDQLDKELRESKNRLENETQKSVVLMTYPHGAASTRVAERAAAAGYARAGTSLYGPNDSRRSKLLLRRTEITAFDDAADFAGKLSGLWDWYALRQGDPASR